MLIIRHLSCLTLLVALVVWLAAPAQAQRPNPLYASIVIDAETGMVLHQRHADKVLHPASLTKIMTLVMAFDGLEKGTLRLNERVPISAHAASMVPSKLGIPAGGSLTVEQAIYALVTRSANDVAAALAEKIGGTEANFGRMMTYRAREIGMSRTRFVNASGLHDPNQVSTARDMARLGRYVYQNYPGYYRYFSTRNFTFQGTSYRNHNRLMSSYTGMDGIKTGYIRASGFNLVASVERNNRRLIGVVFGGRSAQTRNQHMAVLLDNAFARLAQTRSASLVPVPPRKPDSVVVMAAANRNQNRTQPPAEQEARALAPSFDVAAMDPGQHPLPGLVEEGDTDFSVMHRMETGMMAIAAHKGEPVPGHNIHAASATMNQAAFRAGLNPPGRAGDRWSVQIGAFGNRVATDQALRQALAQLPQDLSRASPAVIPLQTERGVLFRARLGGYSRSEAINACRILADCIPIAPQTR